MVWGRFLGTDDQYRSCGRRRATPERSTKGILGGLRTVWFALAFVCIGLETRFTELVSMESGRPAAAFLGAQAFNVLWTLILAYLLFGGVLVPAPVLK